MTRTYTGQEAMEQLKRVSFLKPPPMVWLFEGRRTTHYTGRLTYYYDEGEDAPEMFSIGNDSDTFPLTFFYPTYITRVESTAQHLWKIYVRRIVE